jgi:hypothetical protein
LGNGSSWVHLLDTRGYLVYSSNSLPGSRDDKVIPHPGVGLIGLIWLTIYLRRYAIGKVHTVKVDLDFTLLSD